ncbi:MAG: type II toxin-antitoxin system VapC family toxin [Firmicutes bacterium]|jgi:hypothetical protein|nr:type II toxin-antitoxin system VapC family toxin [Bacillota bacterium]NBI64271.1 hypothetical protein [Clostridiales bacterium]
MNDTQLLWKMFRQECYEVYISDIVLNEIGKYQEEKLALLLEHLNQISYELIRTNEDTIALAEKFIDFGILRKALMTVNI